MERRDRQQLNLVTDTQGIHSDAKLENSMNWQYSLFYDPWTRIRLKAQDGKTVFSNLHTHINVDALREAFKVIKGNKALGVDDVSKAAYGRQLETNLKDLAMRVQRGTYRPQPKREVLIPKANGKTRPIAIACFEDKLVDWVVGKILSCVYDGQFIRNSFGYRPGKSAHNAMEACYYSLCNNKRQHVVEIDFSSFFNTIPHRQMMNMLGKRIADRRFKGLIGRFLKGDLITQQGEILPSEIGTPQGSIMSPILANIYLDEAVDKWFMENYASYSNIIVRYADDAVFFFKDRKVACEFLDKLEIRVKEYGLSLNKEKTRKLTLTKINHEHFNFLGFTFYWGKQASRTILKIKTQKEKLQKSLREFTQWIKQVRNQIKLKEIWSLAKSKIKGHSNYYGYRMNALKLNHFCFEATKSLYKWLNRRSQKRSYTWDGFKERLKHFPLMPPLANMKLKQLGWNPYGK